MNKKLLLTLVLFLIPLLSACASAPKAESPAETAEIATIALHSSLDLSQEGRQPILPQEYDYQGSRLWQNSSKRIPW